MPSRPVAWIAAAVAAGAVVAAADGWRTALLALTAAAGIASTRIRFARECAALLLVVVAAIALGGHAISDDRRPSKAKPAKHHRDPDRAERKRRQR